MRNGVRVDESSHTEGYKSMGWGRHARCIDRVVGRATVTVGLALGQCTLQKLQKHTIDHYISVDQ